MPVSTTQVLSSGIAGTMCANHSGVQLNTVKRIGLAWLLTLPAAILLSASFFALGGYLIPGAAPAPSAEALALNSKQGDLPSESGIRRDSEQAGDAYWQQGGVELQHEWWPGLSRLMTAPWLNTPNSIVEYSKGQNCTATKSSRKTNELITTFQLMSLSDTCKSTDTRV